MDINIIKEKAREYANGIQGLRTKEQHRWILRKVLNLFWNP